MKITVEKIKVAIFKLVVICGILSITYGLGSMFFQRMMWGLADYFVAGLKKVEEKIALDKIRSFGNYQTHLEIMLAKMDKMTFEEFKLEEKRRLCLEIRIASAIGQIIQSYGEAHRDSR